MDSDRLSEWKMLMSVYVSVMLLVLSDIIKGFEVSDGDLLSKVQMYVQMEKQRNVAREKKRRKWMRLCSRLNNMQ